jgi:hypothetical protein
LFPGSRKARRVFRDILLTSWENSTHEIFRLSRKVSDFPEKGGCQVGLGLRNRLVSSAELILISNGWPTSITTEQGCRAVSGRFRAWLYGDTHVMANSLFGGRVKKGQAGMVHVRLVGCRAPHDLAYAHEIRGGKMRAKGKGDEVVR